jgi:(R,R)-butanediol dehydrogenase/meso-butanediol dehydrogenase/diacetyl reductase
MRAAVYHGPGDIRIEDKAEPDIGPGRLLVEVCTVGICGTDVGEYIHEPMFFPVRAPHPVTGKFGPTVVGHEFSGRVIAVAPDVLGFAVGDLIACGSGVSCGRCEPCLAGRTNMCRSYWTVGLHDDGALADLVAVPAGCCFNLAGRQLSADAAALVQPMSIAVHATRRGRLAEDDVVVVVGTGGIGSFITYAASRRGASVLAVDLDPDRLEVAQALGATGTLVAERGEDLADLILRLVEPPTVVFECTATEPGLDTAVRVVADNGRVVVVGHQPLPVTLDMKLVSFGEKEVIGTMAHVFAVDLPAAVELLESGGDELARVAPVVHPLENLLQAGIVPMAEGRQSQIKALFAPGLEVSRPFDRAH